MKMKIIIEGGKTHNVGYRPFLMAKARRLGIPNYESDNIEIDGKQRVIVLIGGDEKQVQKFVEFIKENYPKKAKVDRVWEAEPPERVMPIDEYDKVLAAEQRNTIVQAGLGMIEVQKQTIESINQGFAETKQEFNKMDTKYDKISEKMDSIDNTLRELTKAILALVREDNLTEFHHI